MSSKARPYIVQAFVAIVVVAIGFFIASTFYGDKQTAKRGARTDSGVLVENLALAQGDLRLHEFELVVVGRNASDDFALL